MRMTSGGDAIGAAPLCSSNKIPALLIIIISEYQGSMGLTPLKARAGRMQVRSIQLAWYDEATGSAVVSSVIGKADKVREYAKELSILVFSARCTPDRHYTTREIGLEKEPQPA